MHLSPVQRTALIFTLIAIAAGVVLGAIGAGLPLAIAVIVALGLGFYLTIQRRL